MKRSSQPRLPFRLDEPPFPAGFHYLPQYLDESEQLALALDIRQILERAPLFQQTMPRTGAPLSVRMSNAGDFGWVTDREGGYRYQSMHPLTGEAWPPIPGRLVRLWADVTGEQRRPNLCLINYYDEDSRMGLHQDRGESLDAPVVSVSLGDDATFIVGGLTRSAPKRKFALHSGDVVWFAGPSRLIYHGVQGIALGTSSLLKRAGLFESGRINVTLRRTDEQHR